MAEIMKLKPNNSIHATQDEIVFHSHRGLTKVGFSTLRICLGRDRSEIVENLKLKRIKVVEFLNSGYWILDKL